MRLLPTFVTLSSLPMPDAFEINASLPFALQLPLPLRARSSEVRDQLNGLSALSADAWRRGMPDRDAGRGLARELARMNLSLNFYTQWSWKVDLHNFMNFLRLRADAHAQYEIRVYADRMLEVMRRWVTLSLDTAYRSFGGEVEASSTPRYAAFPIPAVMGDHTRGSPATFMPLRH
ncbi:FAD-dependent thymidylate synthase [Bradyrhizobium sp. LLZ17]|uniref:FAD-dependent thymidylate synthase n=1 Tax=Bradyrhizobium sp. LLZ17 TaxID=3239388 RepID=A0AB39XC04_9BRAD